MASLLKPHTRSASHLAVAAPERPVQLSASDGRSSDCKLRRAGEKARGGQRHDNQAAGTLAPASQCGSRFAPDQLPSFLQDSGLSTRPHAEKLLHRPARLGPGGRPWTSLHTRLQQSLKATGVLEPDDSVLVAVSGGQDSVCLLRALADLRMQWRWRLGVVHCDHGWREDSAQNADFVHDLAHELGLPFHMHQADVRAVATEQAARQWRYGCFAETAEEEGYQKVATAHTATDRAETMLLNLLRGSGPDGLVALARSRGLQRSVGHPGSESRTPGAAASSGAPKDTALDRHGHADERVIRGNSSSIADIRESRDAYNVSLRGSMSISAGSSGISIRSSHTFSVRRVQVVRPLLEFSRSDTEAFCRELRLPVFHDSTNDDNDMRRNRLRNVVMPQLREHFNPRLDQALFRFMEVLEGDMDVLESLAGEVYARATRSVGPGQLELSELNRAPLSLQRRVLHRWLREADIAVSDSTGALTPGIAHAQTADILATKGDGDACLSRSGRSRQTDSTGAGSDDSASGDGHAQSTVSAGSQRSRITPGGSAGLASQLSDLELHQADLSLQGSSHRPIRQVRYDDVAKCLALLGAPNRTNSDSLCEGLVATVLNGRLVLRPAATKLPPKRRRGS